MPSLKQPLRYMTNQGSSNTNHFRMPVVAQRDPYLGPWSARIIERMDRVEAKARELAGGLERFSDFASGHEFFGLHRTADGWVFREWAPNATAIFLKGDFSQWQERREFQLNKEPQNGVWELKLPAHALKHGDHYRLSLHWPGGAGDRIPAWARRVVQDRNTLIFSAQVWAPTTPYQWKFSFRRPPKAALIYEAHVGMAQEKETVGTYVEFRDKVLPRVVEAGYNTLQLMAIQEHPYYGSFGYHVSSFFAASSRFGTPEELKSLIDAAHSAGLAVIMDLVHSHAVKNEVEGISRFDGTLTQFFHEGPRGNHHAWDSRCFDYGKNQVLHFLLSNCRYWLDEFRFDGYRFDGITSMLYFDHGLGKAFTCYDDYFSGNVDEDAVAYLGLANKLIHDIRPDAITVAEDVSGMPGLAAPRDHGGVGFDYRLAMGVPDYWIKLIKDFSDEQWNMGWLWRELTNKREDEKTVSYAESHDQALVGDKTVIFRLADKEMYTHMAIHTPSHIIDRAIALHKMIRLVTSATGGGGYLNFMGNEFGHPEWIDFPREGNGWSCKYARRQWHLVDDQNLKYRFLAEFDRAMVRLAARVDLLAAWRPQIVVEHVDDHVLGFERAGLVFIFNFHPHQDFTDYHIALAEGRYRKVLDSDAQEFGGFARRSPNEVYISRHGFAGDPKRSFIGVNMPARTALVLEKIATKIS